ncbi:50S ribosomal protein L21 [Streptococcus pneumoniae 7879-04]|nr:50S ribosomal protein L21 [Streptococcus pneumoniae 7879-04]
MESSHLVFFAVLAFSLSSGKVTCFKSGSLGNSSNILPKLSHFVNFTAIGVPRF